MKARISLKTIWYGLIALVTLLPVVILLPWIGSKAHSLLLESAMLKEVQSNIAIKNHLNHEIDRIVTLLQNKSDPMAFTLARILDKDMVKELFEAVFERESTVHVLTLVNRQGQLIEGFDRHGDPLKGTGAKDELRDDEEKRIILFDPAGPEVVIPMHGRVYIGSPFLQESDMHFYIAVPVGPLSQPYAALIASVNTVKLWQKIRSQIIRAGVITYLVDSRGSLLIPPPGSNLPVGELITNLDIVRTLIAHKDWKKWEVYDGLNAVRVFGVATLIEALNWGVISEIPERNITGPIAVVLLSAVSVVLVIVFFFGGMGLFFVNRLTKPVTALTNGFDKVAEGDYSQKMPSYPVKEISSVAAGFNRMIYDINQREEELSQFKTTLDLTLDCIFMFDPKTLRFSYINQGAINHVGYTQEELFNMTPLDIKPEYTEVSFREIVAPLLDGRKPSLTLEAVHKHKSGKLIPVEIFLQYIAPSNEAGRFLAIVRDITERKRSEEAIRNIASGVSAETGEGFFRKLVLHLAKVFDANYAFVGLLVKEKSEIVHTLAICARGEIVDNITYSLEDTPCANVVGQQTCAYSSNVQKQFPRDRLLAEKGANSYIGTPLFNSAGEPVGIIAVLDSKPMEHIEQVEEILEIFAARAAAELERLRAEEELAGHRDHLEELVKERTKELKTAQKELVLKERLATLGQLTATVSHEIRNPLGTIRSSLFTIRERARDKVDGIDRALERADRNIIRCNNIIEELLDYARTSRPNLNLEPTVIDDWLGRLLNEQTIPEGISQQIELKSGIEANLDRERFRRAVINILQNACQAITEKDEKTNRNKLMVETSVSEDRLEIHIADTGHGISPENFEKIFEPLFSTKSFGIGLGLSIVKQIMEQHKGGVEIKSKQGKGTTVILWLPI